MSVILWTYYFVKQLVSGPVRWLDFAWSRLRVQGWRAYWPFYRRNRTIVIIRNDVLGDFLISLTVMRAMSKHYRSLGYKICLICGSGNLGMARQSGYFDVILESNAAELQRNRSKALACAKDIFALRPEIIVNLMEGDMTVTATMLAHCSGAVEKVVIGWQTQTEDRNYRRRKLQYLKKNCQNGATIAAYRKSMIVYDYALRKLAVFRNYYYTMTILREPGEGIFDHEMRMAKSLMGMPQGEEIPIDRLEWATAEQPEGLPADYYVIVPGGSKPHCWLPGTKYAEAIDRIREIFPGCIPVFSGTAGEAQVADQIIGLTKDKRGINFCGKTSIPQLMGLMRNARFVIGNDTGGTNLSSIILKPTVCILSGNIPGYYFPNPQYEATRTIYSKLPCTGCYNMCINPNLHEPRKCVTEIKVDEIIRNLMEATK